MTGHGFPAEVAVGQVRVVGVAGQPDVRHAVLTAKAERAPMVEFEPVAFRTATTLRVYVAASIRIALAYGTPDRRWDVS
jgi:hypothetical protein